MPQSNRMTELCVKIIVAGKVQGVGFRYHTQRKASELGITGYVKNRENGDVEIVAYGTTERVELLQHWLREGGPKTAVVTQVTITAKEIEFYRDFQIRY